MTDFKCINCGKSINRESVVTENDMYCDECLAKIKHGATTCPLCLGHGFIVDSKIDSSDESDSIIVPSKLKGGQLYKVKALDHFSRTNYETKEVYMEFIGYFIEDMGLYLKFCSLVYTNITTVRETYSNEFRFVIKSAIIEITELPDRLVGEFKEKTIYRLPYIGQDDVK